MQRMTAVSMMSCSCVVEGCGSDGQKIMVGGKISVVICGWVADVMKCNIALGSCFYNMYMSWRL